MDYNLFYFYIPEEILLMFMLFWCFYDTYLKFLSKNRMVDSKELGVIFVGILLVSLFCGCFMANAHMVEWDFNSKAGLYLKVASLFYLLVFGLLVPDELNHWGSYKLGLCVSLFLMVSFSSWLICWFVLELLGLCFYIIMVMGSSEVTSIEGSAKYLIFNKMGSGLIYVGCVMFWLTLDGGWYKFMEVSINLTNIDFMEMCGFICLYLGMSMKLGLFPFSFWLVDSYESASVLGLGLLTVMGKMSMLVFCWKVFLGLLLFNVGSYLMMGCSVLCILVCSILGLSQVSLGRFWVYSSLVNMSYILLALVSLSKVGEAVLLLYVVYYSFMSLGVYSIWFMVMSQLHARQFVTLLDIVKYSKSSSKEGILFWISMLSMAGMPPLVGFFLKYSVMLSLVTTGQWVTAFVCILCGVFTMAFYLNSFTGFFVGNFWGAGLYPRPSWSDHYMLAFLLVLNVIIMLNADVLTLLMMDSVLV